MGRPQESLLVRSARFPAWYTCKTSIRDGSYSVTEAAERSCQRSLLGKAASHQSCDRPGSGTLYTTHTNGVWCCVHDAHAWNFTGMCAHPVFGLAMPPAQMESRGRATDAVSNRPVV